MISIIILNFAKFIGDDKNVINFNSSIKVINKKVNKDLKVILNKFREVPWNKNR